MRRTERAAYRTKFYSNLSSPTQFDEEPYLLGYLPQIQFFYFSDAVSNALLLSASARSIVRSAKIDWASITG